MDIYKKMALMFNEIETETIDDNQFVIGDIVLIGDNIYFVEKGLGGSGQSYYPLLMPLNNFDPVPQSPFKVKRVVFRNPIEKQILLAMLKNIRRSNMAFSTSTTLNSPMGTATFNGHIYPVNYPSFSGASKSFMPGSSPAITGFLDTESEFDEKYAKDFFPKNYKTNKERDDAERGYIYVSSWAKIKNLLKKLKFWR
jgi:hypothetical protein